jgi:hypothetical protein
MASFHTREGRAALEPHPPYARACRAPRGRAVGENDMKAYVCAIGIALGGYGNATCNDGLVCQTPKCASLDGGGATSVSGGIGPSGVATGETGTTSEVGTGVGARGSGGGPLTS